MVVKRTESSPRRSGIFKKYAVPVWMPLIGASIVLLALATYLPVLIYPAITNHELNQLGIHGLARISIQDERLTLQNNLRTALIQILGGIAVLSGATVAWRQLRHSISDAQAQRNSARQTLYLEHYSKAIQCIGDPSATVRLGGVHLLAMLAETSVDHRTAVSNVLASFISNRSSWPPAENAPAIGTPPSRLPALGSREPDIQGAVTAIGTYGGLRLGPIPLRLMRCDLRAANMIGGHFDGMDLTGTHLEGAEMQNARFIRTILAGACLVGADLTGADLSRADLRGADLGATIISELKLEGAVYDSFTVWPQGFTAAAAERRGAQRDT